MISSCTHTALLLSWAACCDFVHHTQVVVKVVCLHALQAAITPADGCLLNSSG